MCFTSYLNEYYRSNLSKRLFSPNVFIFLKVSLFHIKCSNEQRCWAGFRNVLFNGFWQFSCCSFQLAKKTCQYTYRNSYINMFVFSFRSTHIFYLHVLYIYIYYTQKLKSQKQDVSEWILNKKTHFPFSQIFPFHAVQILNVKRPHFKRSILSVTHAYTIDR